MRKPIEDKPPLAAWATLAREEAGMSVEEVVDALAERGHAVKAATIRGLEGGSKGASVRLRRLMADVYGTKPPGVALERPTAPDALVQALHEQTAAITALVGEMQKARQEIDPRLVAQILAFATQTGFLPREDDPDDLPAGSPSSNRRSQSRLEVVRPRTPRP